MSNDYVDLVSGEIIKGNSFSGNKRDNQNITINDAQSEIGKVLVKEFGSDEEYKAQGKVDTRRFSNISALDVYWLMFFENIPDSMGGKYSRKICDDYRNHRYSVGGNHKNKVIDFQESLRDSKKNMPKKEDKGIFQKINPFKKKDEESE